MRQLWVKKHAPKNFNQFCFPDSKTKKAIKQLIDSNNIPHLLLVGAAGSGKSSLAKLLIEHNNIDPIDVLKIDASLENNVDTVRDKINTFVKTSSWGESVKIVLLEEFDHMSIQAQSTLREMMVQYSDDVRFILTANFEHKIIDAIKSRCQEYTFVGINETSALKRAIEILEEEQVNYDPDDVIAIVKHWLPDFRKVINILEKQTVDGVLIPTTSTEKSDIEFSILSGDFESVIKWATTVATPNDLSNMYRKIFQALVQFDSVFNNYDLMDKAIICIAKYQYESSASADPVICFSAMVSELRQISKGNK